MGNLHPLSEDYKVLAFDWLGCGGSARPKFNAESTEDAENFFLESFESWRKEMGLDQFILIGHSLGGYLSTVYALRYPERVNKLILVSPVGIPRKPDEGWDGKKKPLFIKVARKFWEWNFTWQGIVRAAGPKGPDLMAKIARKRFPKEEPETVERMATYLYQTTALKGSGEYALNHILEPGAWARQPLCDRLPRLQVPVSFIYGSNDWMN